jgi:hypothetical protein
MRTASSGSSSSKEELEKAVRRARVYCSSTRGSGNWEVWIARLDLEHAAGTSDQEIQPAWAEARRSVEGTPEEVEKVWMWGASHDDDEKMLEVSSISRLPVPDSLHAALPGLSKTSSGYDLF